MKKIIALMVGFFMMINTTIFASTEATVNINVNGEVKNGNKITISINVKDVSRLYAASVDYIYDPSEIKVTSIEGSSLIKNSENHAMELGGETDKDGNKANYQMTFTGKVDGATGSGELVKIEAEVLKDFNLVLNENNLKIKLVYVSNDYEGSSMNFKYNGFGKEEVVKPSNPEIGSDSEANSKPVEGKNPSLNNNGTNSHGNSNTSTLETEVNIENTNSDEILSNDKNKDKSSSNKKGDEESLKSLKDKETISEDKKINSNKKENSNTMIFIVIILVAIVFGCGFILKRKRNMYK